MMKVMRITPNDGNDDYVRSVTLTMTNMTTIMETEMMASINDLRTRHTTNPNSPHQLERDAQVIAEVEILDHMNYVVLVVFVLAPECVQNLDLH